ncbi:flagellar motor protein MotB [Halomonas saccharevitans]|uniref:Flagellar motor protein MotB n=1 Tax=Halomonas saccharevitans TaxID=416872 RepID=A0ABU3NC32_9GAMM|nr:flagellar motor protein MotB [Halomonas saccharevitans]MDT8878740.1 flagellar motor protein MotB [Halomonas saccharevitans]
MARQRSRSKNEIPAWMVTYADLMSLLLCFFVLLLSFAEIDLERFEQLAGEMSKAFGVQREVPAETIPKGTSAVMDRFSPAEPEPTLRDEVRQTTTRERPMLDTHRMRLEQRLKALQRNLEDRLQTAIDEGGVDVERDASSVVIRVNEQGSFPSGSAAVTPSFAELLGDLSDTLADAPGSIAVRGHTDNVPVRSSRYASNWDLSAMRSAVVANLLLENEALAAGRVTVTGHADTRPIASNDIAEGRARNRRVEIIIKLGDGREAVVPPSLSGPAILDQALPSQTLPDQALSDQTVSDQLPSG